MQSPPLTCVLVVNRDLEGWKKMLDKLCMGIEGLRLSIDGWLVYLRGEVDPKLFIKKLYRARSFVALYRIDYGYEKNPEEIRKPHSHHFMRCTFELNPLEISWYKKIIGALKTIQGVSFTIDAQPPMMGYQMEQYQATGYHKIYLSGNIEFGMLMKMLVKTGIELSGMDYGVENEDPNLMPPPPLKLEDSENANGTKTQPKKDTVLTPPKPEVVTTSTHNQVEYKESRSGFRRFCC